MRLRLRRDTAGILRRKEWNVMEELLEALLKECQPNTAQGKVATYIPELAKGDPSVMGIYVLRSDGRHYQAGAYL